MGRVEAWGYNNLGQTDVPESALTDVIDIAAGREHSVALKSDGSVVCWGGEMFTSVPESASSNVIAVSAGWYHSLALKSDGSVVSWGYKADVPENLPSMSMVRGGELFSLGITNTGGLVSWGEFAPIIPESLSENVVDIVADKQEWMVLTSDGQIYTSNSKMNEIPSEAHGNVSKIACGNGRYYVVKTDGSVINWVYDVTVSDEPLSAEYTTDVSNILAGSDFSVFVKTTGELLVVGNEWAGQNILPTGYSGLQKITVGMHHGLLLVQEVQEV
jgi:alpha-tubulin suppressor-like RCC1 family protein